MAELNKMQRFRAKARDVAIPGIVDQGRRDSCKDSLIKFAKTYFPAVYYLPLAQFQLDRMERTQQTIEYGGSRADAQPRGTGKTTEAYVAALWAVLTGRCRFFLVAKANDDDASAFIDTIKAQLEDNDLLLEDYPEVCAPIRALGGVPQRTKSQTAYGAPTQIEWKTNRVMLPKVEGSIASGAILASVGLDGSIRGQLRRGERPDFVLVDDPENRRSASSPAMMAKLEKTINEDLGVLAGPGKKISTLWRGTVIASDCLIDRYTNRTLHPEWAGTRQAALVEYPKNQDLWIQYLDLRRAGMRDGSDETGRKATQFYVGHREEMDAGAVVAWEENYVRYPAPDGSPLEVSALQHLYDEMLRVGDAAFASEYQNQPLNEPGSEAELTPERVMIRVNGHAPNVVPAGHTVVVRYIDVGARELHYVVRAYTPDASSSAVIDYSIVGTGVSETADVKGKKAVGRKAMELLVLDTLRTIRAEEQAGLYVDMDGGPVSVALTLVDAGYLTSTVQRVVRESGPTWRAAKGFGKSQGMKRFTRPKVTPKGELVEMHWFTSRQATGDLLWCLDADHWKLTTHQRLLQDVGTPGACTLYGSSETSHKTLAMHICAETWNPEKQQWTKNRRYNHFLDCMAGCDAAADMLGVRLIPKTVKRKAPSEVKHIKRNAVSRRSIRRGY